jgi:hypothetical protein
LPPLLYYDLRQIPISIPLEMGTLKYHQFYAYLL